MDFNAAWRRNYNDLIRHNVGPYTAYYFSYLAALVAYYGGGDVSIISGGRDPYHNASVGGVDSSQHLLGRDGSGGAAVDAGFRNDAWRQWAADVWRSWGFTWGGDFNYDKNPSHFDSRRS